MSIDYTYMTTSDHVACVLFSVDGRVLGPDVHHSQSLGFSTEGAPMAVQFWLFVSSTVKAVHIKIWFRNGIDVGKP